jgi:ATPase subunit of ABC transporter with duplicated ATPase domains
MQTNTDTTKLSAIDRALAAAKARKAAKGHDASDPVPTPKAKVSKAVAKERQVDEVASQQKAAVAAERAAAKAAKLAQLEEERTARRTARAATAAAKAEARAAASSSRTPAHMKKVTKAAEKLPAMTSTTAALFGEATANLSRDQVAALALHLQHYNRAAATMRAATAKLENGDEVRIVGGDPRFIGMRGKVDRAQRIRCYVEVPGVRKPVYLFTSDVERVEAEAVAATA